MVLPFPDTAAGCRQICYSDARVTGIRKLEAGCVGRFGSGGVTVNFGSVVVGGKLVCVTTEIKWPGKDYPEGVTYVSRASHHNTEHDPDTTYAKPKELQFAWSGPSLLKDASGKVSAELKVDVGSNAAPKGLIEKVDVLAEIPAMVKAVISYVAGTKPYVYQACGKPLTLFAFH